jgi:DNA-binding MarR family transcriptional regulator
LKTSPSPESGAGKPEEHPDAEPRDHVDRVREQWADVRPDLDTTPVGIVARVGRAAAYFDQSTNALMAEHGLSRSSWDVLASLRRAGAPYECSPTELYRILMRTSGTMTNRLGRLERTGLIERIPDPRDGRGLLVRLSPKGLQLVDEIAPLHLDNERRLLDSLPPADRRALERILRRLLTDFESSHSAPPQQGRSRL